MNKIKIAIVGVGNCASSLIQGIEYYKDKHESDAMGLMHWDIGGYKPSDIEVVALITNEEHTFLSSTTVREIASLGGDITTMVPQHVAIALHQRFSQFNDVQHHAHMTSLRD